MKIQNEQLIKKWEDLVLKAYKPTPNDVWTIGWGHTKGVKQGQVISRETAQRYFDEDTAWVENTLNTLVKVRLSQNQYDALGSLVFNIGGDAFKKSTLLKKLNQGNYDEAAKQFPRWNKQDGKVLKGLVRRRAEEMAYFTSNVAITSAKPDITSDNKPIVKSKEAVGGLLMAILGTGASTLIENKEAAVTGLSIALVAFGVFFLANRLYARFKGDR